MSDIEALIDQLDAAERDGLQQRFFAPYTSGSAVRVRIAGVIYEMQVEGQHEAGFYVFQPRDREHARVVRAAKRREVRAYLSLFPQVRLVVVDKPEALWLAIAALGGTQKLEVEGVVPLWLAEGVGRFDTALARFDGQRFWFEGRDKRRERAAADYLRRARENDIGPDELTRKGLTPQEKRAYALARAWQIQRRGQTVEGRLREALSHAGGQLDSFVEHRDRYQVSWTVSGRRYTSAIGKGDLTVMVAGICLAGQDRRFDLQSLVGVMREAHGDVLRIGDGGMGVERYFEIHPEDP